MHTKNLKRPSASFARLVHLEVVKMIFVRWYQPAEQEGGVERMVRMRESMRSTISIQESWRREAHTHLVERLLCLAPAHLLLKQPSRARQT